jgi:hypothetical protein
MSAACGAPTASRDSLTRRHSRQSWLHSVPGRLGVAGQAHVHVVAAEQEVFPNRSAAEREAGLDLHQREVGRAPAHVYHEDRFVLLDQLPPVLLMVPKPRVEGRQRLLDQHHVLQARLGGGFERELPGHLVEGSGNGENHLLLAEHARRPLLVFETAEGVVPGGTDVRQIARGDLHRGDHPSPQIRAPGQNAARAIHPGMGQPTLGRSDQPVRNRCALHLREAPDGMPLLFVPWQLKRPGRQLRGPGQVAERRQEFVCPHLACRDKLGNGELAGRGLAFCIHVADRAVCRTQIDADHEAGRALENGERRFRTHAGCRFPVTRTVTERLP